MINNHRYLKELIRYIHLNPVRANLIDDPSEYPWSSHRAYLMQQEFTWLARDDGFDKFGDSRQEAVEAFHHFLVSGIGQVNGIDFKQGNTAGIIGDDLFIDHIQKEIGSTADRDRLEIDLRTLISVITIGIKLMRKGQEGPFKFLIDMRGCASWCSKRFAKSKAA